MRVACFLFAWSNAAGIYGNGFCYLIYLNIYNYVLVYTKTPSQSSRARSPYLRDPQYKLNTYS